jgi:hypothetical protein
MEKNAEIEAFFHKNAPELGRKEPKSDKPSSRSGF